MTTTYIECDGFRVRRLADCPDDVATMARWLSGRIVIDPVVTNVRAIRSYEKCGFRKVKVLPRHEFSEGRWTDNWLMVYQPAK